MNFVILKETPDADPSSVFVLSIISQLPALLWAARRGAKRQADADACAVAHARHRLRAAQNQHGVHGAVLMATTASWGFVLSVRDLAGVLVGAAAPEAAPESRVLRCGGL